MSKERDLKVFSLAGYADALGDFIGYGYNVDEKIMLAEYYGGVIASDSNVDFYSKEERLDVLQSSDNWVLVEYTWIRTRDTYTEKYLLWKDYDHAKAWMDNDIKRGEK